MTEEFNNKEVQLTIQCQRNWDWDNPVSPEDLEILNEYVAKPPQQQGERLFDIISINNNYDAVNSLQQICYNLEKYDFSGNPQAHLVCPNVYIWTTSSGYMKDSEKTMFQLGMHFGIVARKAIEMGYRTGFVACGPHVPISWRGWCLDHDIETTTQINESFVIALAVGNGKPGVEYNVDQLDSYPHTHKKYNWPIVTEL